MKYKLITLLFFNYFFIEAQDLQLYIGTFTNENSKGIYKATFNSETGDLSTPELAISIDDPSFLAYSLDRKYLYSANAKGFASSYKINEDGTLSLLTRVNTHGKGACHIAVNSEGNKAVVSTYGGGTVPVFPINTDGSLAPAAQVFDHNSENEKARAHSAQFYKNELFVSDLGRNALYQYKLENNSYKLKSEAIVPMEGNPGPRHFVLTKDEQFIYVINEYGGSITSIKRTDSGFEQIDFDSTLNENYKGPNSCADIHLSEDERFLYGSNRGENSIAVFERNTKNGKITKIQNISVHGDWPRNFTLDPTGKFLLVANKKSNNISIFKIDNETGKLSFIHDVKTPTPVCLLF
ncbi:MAG: lactonase family protein [Jejuia sp.]